MKYILSAILLFIISGTITATTWSVGPTQTYTFCSQVVSVVQSEDTVEIDFANYLNDPQVQWNQNDLYIVGIGGRPRLEAGSIIPNDPTNGKGIFVISGDDVTIKNIEFANASVMDNKGPSEFGIVGDAVLQGWDRSGDLSEITVPTLNIGA